ncbi:unnamed protein product, partial [Rotaria sordida]
DPSNDSNNNSENKDFIVRMRTSAMPTFRKLYKILSSNGSGIFQNSLPQASDVLNITYSNLFLWFSF